MAYEHVNNEWPGDVPAMTFDEGVRATRRLYRKFLKRKCRWSFRETSGRRYGGMDRPYVWFINPAGTFHHGGWWLLVHNLSHHFARILHPLAKPHDHRHHFLEKQMVAHVVRSGWLTGKLRPKPKAPRPAVDPRAERRARLVARLKRWESKEARARRAAAKVRRSLAAMDRAALRVAA
jgi:hypothetical protein